MHKHPTDRQAYNRAYYLAHRDEQLAKARAWREAHRNDPNYLEDRARYMRAYRWRKRWGR